MAWIAGWSVDKHRVEVHVEGFFVRVSIDEVDQKLSATGVEPSHREGYNQAMREKKTYIGFLMILMQRLVTSSTRAIITTLEKRLAVLHAPGEQLTLLPSLTDEEWGDLDGQDQLDSFLKTRLAAEGLFDERHKKSIPFLPEKIGVVTSPR